MVRPLSGGNGIGVAVGVSVAVGGTEGRGVLVGGKVRVAVGVAVSAGGCTAVWLAALSTTAVAAGVGDAGAIKSVGTGVGTAVGAVQAANPTRHKIPTNKTTFFKLICQSSIAT